MKKIFAAFIAMVALLSGCSTTGEYKDYLQAQERLTTASIAARKPMVSIRAIEGQSITGLASIEVYSPDSTTQAQQVATPPRNEWAGVVGQGLGVIGTIGGIWAGGTAASNLATAVGGAAGQGFKYVQTPQANMTTTTTTTTNSLSGTGAIGGGYSSTPTTTTTDNHSILNSNNPVTTTTTTP